MIQEDESEKNISFLLVAELTQIETILLWKIFLSSYIFPVLILIPSVTAVAFATSEGKAV